MKITSSLTTDPSSAAPKNQLQGTTDEFLKLFMAQLQHQDPLDPTSGADMVAQLAQMTGVEQSRQANERLQDLLAAQASQASASLTSLIGHDVQAATGAFQLTTDGSVPPIDVTSTAPMHGAAVVITDATGKEVRRIPVTDGATSASLQWDGKDASGKTVEPGSYQVSVDAGASSASVTSQWHGRVDAVVLTVDGPRLRIGGVLVAPATIATIGGLATVADNSQSQGAI